MNATTPAATAPRRSRRLLVPLATLAAAGALVVGSGASFTSASANTTSVVTSGSLTQTNSRDAAAIFNVNNIKPGDTVTGSVTIANTGSLGANFKVTETSTNGFGQPGMLRMKITESTGKVIHDGTFGDLGGTDDIQELDTFAPGESRTYTYVVHLDVNASNDNQGDSAKASYVWDATQLTGDANVNETGRTVTSVVKANPDAVNAPAPTPAG